MRTRDNPDRDSGKFVFAILTISSGTLPQGLQPVHPVSKQLRNVCAAFRIYIPLVFLESSSALVLKLSMPAIHPRYLPVPYQDSAEAGRLILRDGSTATVRLAHPRDRELMTGFFNRLSKDSRQRRFFSTAEPSAK